MSATLRLTICSKCEEAVSLDPVGGTVKCRVGHLCCGGSLSIGDVNLTTGSCNREYWPKPLGTHFDRVVVLTLKRRGDRLEKFWNGLRKQPWPFKEPQVVHGVDGNKVPVPAGIKDATGVLRNNWLAGGGAWGCMSSHRRILEDAIMDGVGQLLVLEDDAEPADGFADKVKDFMAQVPRDWDGIMFGGQHFGFGPIFSGNIRRCYDCQRTHAYAVRGRYMRDLYAMWQSYSGHCDHAMGPFMRNYNVYAPEPFLIGQRRSHSDISGRLEPKRFWSGNDPKARVAILRCSRDVLNQLRRLGVHGGYQIDPVTGVDIGLLAVYKSKESTTNRKRLFRGWLDVVRTEATAFDINLLGIWLPEFDEEMRRIIESGVGQDLLQINVPTVDAFLEAWTAYATPAK